MRDVKIFLIGMMGAGKTSVGLNLSRLLDLPFFDTDDLIGVDSYFDSHSLDEFRTEEIKQINQLSNRKGSAIVSIGGGSILAKQTRDIIRSNSCFFLQASINNLIDRIKQQNISRPLVHFLNNGDIDRIKFRQLYKDREQHYLDLADFIINTNNENISNIAMTINRLVLENEIIN